VVIVAAKTQTIVTTPASLFEARQNFYLYFKWEGYPMTKISIPLGRSAFVALVAFMGSVIVSGESAEAQSRFCPTTSTGINPENGQPFTVNQIQQISGNCTNPSQAGAFSGAALASQAIGDLAGSSTIIETTTAVKALEERREAPPQECPAGAVLVDGICKPRPAQVVTPAPIPPAPAVTPPQAASAAPAPAPAVTPPQAAPAAPAPAPAVTPAQAAPAAPAPATRVVAKRPAKAKMARPAPSVALPTRKPAYEGPPPPPIYDRSFRIGSWAQGFGDYEHRTGSQNTFFNCCTDPTLGNQPILMTLDASSTTSSGGFVGGVDFTKRGLSGPQDGLIAGLLGGYVWNNITINTSAISSDPTKVANGSNRTTANINGPSLGLYATYFNGPFSNDFLIKNDFLSLNENSSGILGFGTCFACLAIVGPILTANIPTATAYTNPNFNSGSTNLNQLTISDNMNYKIPFYERVWIEPTAGLLYVNSSYSSSAAALGLSDGYIFRIQGGAKLGLDSTFGDPRLTTVLTGLVFDDVVVHGNNIQAGSFGPSGNILSDQGKVQGEAIASINFDLGRGLSASVQGDVYGGQGVFGAGGKATIRMQW
jgi:Autotransporter beta-domain